MRSHSSRKWRSNWRGRWKLGLGGGWWVLYEVMRGRMLDKNGDIMGDCMGRIIES